MPTDHRDVILLVFANDRYGGEAAYLRDLANERKRIERALAPALRDRPCRLVIEHNVTHEDFFDALDEYGRHIIGVHFAGHADPSGLLFEDATGRQVPARIEGIAQGLAGLDALRWVFLNGCGTLPHVAALYERISVPVVATEHAILDRVAVTFARRFYFGLARGDSIDAAFGSAQAELEARHDTASAITRGQRAGPFFSPAQASADVFRMLRPAERDTLYPWVLCHPPDDQDAGAWQLVPPSTGRSRLAPILAALAFVALGAVFLGLGVAIERNGGSEDSQPRPAADGGPPLEADAAAPGPGTLAKDAAVIEPVADGGLDVAVDAAVDAAVHAAVDATPDADPKAVEMTRLRALAERQGSRCQCSSLSSTRKVMQRDHDADALDVWGRFCGRGGACARLLQRRVDREIEGCACGRATLDRVEELKRRYGIDRGPRYRDRCQVPGLPTSCVQ